MSDVINVSVPLIAGGTAALGTVYKLGFKVPTDANGGGITVLAAGVASPAAVASGSAPLYEVVTLSSSSVVSGTIGTVAAAAYTAGTVREMPITDSWADGGEFVAFKELISAVNANQLYLTGYVQYKMGR